APAAPARRRADPRRRGPRRRGSLGRGGLARDGGRDTASAIDSCGHAAPQPRKRAARCHPATVAEHP
ncbi:hypothetical protein HMPREF0731_2029, partial [Pseudoroseomonas cervicalis ATCC 49957]